MHLFSFPGKIIKYFPIRVQNAVDYVSATATTTATTTVTQNRKAVQPYLVFDRNTNHNSYRHSNRNAYRNSNLNSDRHSKP